MTGFEDLTLLLMSSGGFIPMATMQPWRGAFRAFVRSCSTSPHVNSSSNIFWGAKPKQQQQQKKSMKIKPGVRGPQRRGASVGNSMQKDAHMNSGSGEQNSMWALTVRSLTVTDVGFETRPQTRKEEQKRNRKTTHAAPVCLRFGL